MEEAYNKKKTKFFVILHRFQQITVK